VGLRRPVKRVEGAFGTFLHNSQTEKGRRIRFRGPRQPRWRDGVQALFSAVVPNEFLAEKSTPWVLKSFRWRRLP